MTLEESLPNGHDAELKSFSVDYERRTAVLTLDLFLATPGPRGSPDEGSSR
ncbi:MAG: hypothetical protein ACXU86_08715 [Archangium sp.]